MAKPSILHVIEAFDGGACRHVCELLPELAARGYPVALAASFRRNPPLAREAALGLSACGVAVHELPMCRAAGPLSDARAALRLARLIRALRPDIIHTHSSKAGVIGRLVGAARKIPVVHTPHAFPFLMGGAGAGLFRRIERALRPKAAVLIAVSREEEEEALALGYPPWRVRYIPNGSGYPCLAPVEEAALPRAVGFFGRLCRQKGADVLLRAVADAGAEADLYGRGGDEGFLRRQCRGLGLGVRFMGECPQREVVARMRQYAVIAVPSRWEGCPYVILDAWAAGAAVVAARVGGVPDLICDGADGVLFPVGDARALSLALASLLRDAPRRRALALAARDSFARRTLGGMAGRVEAAYADAVGCGAKKNDAP